MTTSPTTAPLSPEREAEIREHVASMSNFSLGNLAARDLLAELDRVRGELGVERTWYRHKARGERTQRERAESALQRLRALGVRFAEAFAEVELTAERLNRAVQGCARYRQQNAGLTEALRVAEAERNDLKKRVTDLENGPLTVYRARQVVGSRAFTIGYDRTREEARARCVAALRAAGPALVPDVIFDWIGQDDTEVLNISTPAEPRPDVTDYVVTAVPVSGAAADAGVVR